MYDRANTYTARLVDTTVFKAYDIRGRTDNGQITPGLYEAIGRQMVRVLGFTEVAVGRDCRDSSPALFKGLTDGIRAAGGNVIDLGEVPTDAVYFYSGSRNIPGAMITASHNPAGYNGLKICRAGAGPVGIESGLAEVRDAVVEARDMEPVELGALSEEDIVDDYVAHLFSIVDPESISDLRIAVDAGNGMAGVALERVFAQLTASLHGIYLDPDGTFPNHPADPLVEENLRDLQDVMRKGEFELGVAFDGDADRAFFLDDQLKPLPGSTVTSLIARAILVDQPGASVVHNLIVSKAVPEIVTELGGEPIRTRVGHSFIKQVMAESGAVFGGEHSGHYYFKENFRADSGMLAMLYLLRVLSRDGRPLSQVRQDVERYASSGEINFRVADTESAMAAVAAGVTDGRIDHLDGLTVELGSGWFNLRPSNTEPLLRLNAEGSSKDDVDSLVSLVRDVLEERR